MKLDEYARLDGLDLAGLVHSGQVEARELCELARAAIDAVNDKLNFIAERMDQTASRRLDGKEITGRFSGLPILVKDGVAVTGERSPWGCRMLRDFRPDHDSEFVRRLNRAGFVIIGSSAAPEFGTSATTESALRGATRNPWNLDRSAGGSSGGACAAVASGVLPIAMGSDGGGSIRTPAHCCGVFGLKPSRGRSPVGPMTGGGFGLLGAPHVVTRSVRDSAAMLDELAGPEAGSPFIIEQKCPSYLAFLDTAPARLRIAFSTKNPAGPEVHPDCIDGVNHAVRICSELGHTVEEQSFQYSWEELMSGLDIALCMQIAASLDRLSATTGQPVDENTIERMNRVLGQRGQRLPVTAVPLAQEIFHRICLASWQFFQDYDIFITPTAVTPAPPLGWINANAPDIEYEDWLGRAIDGYSAFTPVFNVTGQPAMSVPMPHGKSGLPIGVQFAGRLGEEHTLLRLARELEIATPWANRQAPSSILSLFAR